MAAPIYSQSEVDALIAMSKLAVFESWHSPRKGDKIKRRHNTLEEVRIISIECDPEKAGVGFEMDVCHNTRTDTIAIQLYAEIAPRPLLSICRYDIQDAPHDNDPTRCPELSIAIGQPHRHIYKEQAIIEGEPDDWDLCAESIDVAIAISPRISLERLKKRFMKIKFEDRDTRGELLNFGTP